MFSFATRTKSICSVRSLWVSETRSVLSVDGRRTLLSGMPYWKRLIASTISGRGERGLLSTLRKLEALSSCIQFWTRVRISVWLRYSFASSNGASLRR